MSKDLFSISFSKDKKFEKDSWSGKSEWRAENFKEKKFLQPKGMPFY